MTRSKTATRNSSKSRQSPAASITSQLEAIDTSPLDELVETRAEQVKLKEYLEKAEERRAKVSERVWKQVVADYTERARVLSDAAAPLERRVRLEYARLRELRESIEQGVADARFRKDEAEFRHELGELTDDEVATRLEQPEKQIAQGEADLEAVDGLKARFVDAFDSEEDLALPDDDDETPSADATLTPEEPGADDADAPAASAASAEVGQDTPVDMLKTQPPSATRVFNADDLVKKPAPPAEAAADSDDVDDDEDDGRTFLLPAAALLVTPDGEDVASEYRLASLNYIGRAEENQLRMAQPGVSRKHALVSATDRGYMIQDLDSQNGTFVNGERITEHTLADGDQIAIGNVQLVFRTPWPEPSGANRGR